MRTRFASPVPCFMYMRASAPDAPPLSDTTIGCFMRLFFWMAACIIRAIWSEAPPAPAATTISTGFVGSQAIAAVDVRAITDSTAAQIARLVFMGSPLVVFLNSSGFGEGRPNYLYQGTCAKQFPRFRFATAIALLGVRDDEGLSKPIGDRLAGPVHHTRLA